MSTSSKISSSALVHVNKRLRVGVSHAGRAEFSSLFPFYLSSFLYAFLSTSLPSALFAKVVFHRLNFLLKLSAPLAFSVMAEYQPEEIGTSENGSRGSRMGITPLQKATSGR